LTWVKLCNTRLDFRGVPFIFTLNSKLCNCQSKIKAPAEVSDFRIKCPCATSVLKQSAVSQTCRKCSCKLVGFWENNLPRRRQTTDKKHHRETILVSTTTVISATTVIVMHSENVFPRMCNTVWCDLYKRLCIWLQPASCKEWGLFLGNASRIPCANDSCYTRNVITYKVNMASKTSRFMTVKGSGG